MCQPLSVEPPLFSSSDQKDWSHPWHPPFPCTLQPIYQQILAAVLSKYSPLLTLWTVLWPQPPPAPSQPCLLPSILTPGARGALSWNVTLFCISCLPVLNLPKAPSLRVKAESSDGHRALHHLSPGTPVFSGHTAGCSALLTLLSGSSCFCNTSEALPSEGLCMCVHITCALHPQISYESLPRLNAVFLMCVLVQTCILTLNVLLYHNHILHNHCVPPPTKCQLSGKSECGLFCSLLGTCS